MFDARGQYIDHHKPRGRSVPTSPPSPPPAPSPAIASDLHSSLAPFLSVSSSCCPPSFSRWLSLPHALLARHLRNSREVSLLQQIAASATQLDELVERLYEAIVEGESLEHVQRHLPHRCPTLPDPSPSALPSDSSESSSSSSSSDSSAPPASNAALTALAASLAPFVHCTFPVAHQPSFPSSLSSAVGGHVRSIGAVFVQLTGVLLELQAGLGELQSFQQLNGRLSEELRLEGCEALAATKAAVAGLEDNLVDRITALLSARLAYQQSEEPPTPSHMAANTAVGRGTAAQSEAATSSSARATSGTTSDRAYLDATMKPPQPLPLNSPSLSIASSASSSASFSSSTSSSSLSPNTRLDLILGLQPTATAKRKADTALDAHAPPLPQHQRTQDGKSEESDDNSRPAAKRKRTEESDQSEGVLQQSSARGTPSDQDDTVAPTSMSVLFTSAVAVTDGGVVVAQSSVPDSPQVIATAPLPQDVPTVTLTATPRARPASPTCEMQLSLSSSASSSAAPASPLSCPPSPVVSPLMSASQPTHSTSHSASLSRRNNIARSHSIGHLMATANEQQTSSTIVVGQERRQAAGASDSSGVQVAVVSIPLSPNVAMSVDEAEEDSEQQKSMQERIDSISAVTGGSTAVVAAKTTAATSDATTPTVAAMVGEHGSFSPTRTHSHGRCSQERGAVDSMAGVDAEGGANLTMPPLDYDSLQLHSSQPQTMAS